MRETVFLLALSLFYPISGYAEDGLGEILNCDIKQSLKITDVGKVEAQQQFWSDAYSKDQLLIDRSSGTALHPYFGTSPYKRTLYLSRGSNEWALKILGYTLFSNSANGQPVESMATFIEVFNYVEGVEKPFVAIEGSNIVVGLCH